MSSSDVKGNARPGLKAGRSSELTIICKLKPGGAERMRKRMSSPDFGGPRDEALARLAKVHELKFLIFDNDTRIMFMATFDGTWDDYISDFANAIPDHVDAAFGEAEDYPGARNPKMKDFIVEHQVTASWFYSAYPDASVRDIWKALKIKNGLDIVLDAASS